MRVFATDLTQLVSSRRPVDTVDGKGRPDGSAPGAHTRFRSREVLASPLLVCFSAFYKNAEVVPLCVRVCVTPVEQRGLRQRQSRRWWAV
jgi:hypothetical protein